MLWLILTTMTLAFCAFFWYIGVWRLGTLPVALLLSFAGSQFINTSTQNETKSPLTIINQLINQYSLLLARLMLLAGVGVILNFFWLELLMISLILTGINLWLRLISLAGDYTDGKEIYPIAYHLLTLTSIIIVQSLSDIATAFLAFQWAIIMNVGVYATTGITLRTLIDIPKTHRYILFLLGQAMIIITIAHSGANIYLSIWLAQAYMTALYYAIYKTQSLHRYFEHSTHHINAKDILAGKRVTNPGLHRIAQRKELLNKLYTFIKHIPQSIKALFSVINIMIILIIMTLFFLDLDWQKMNRLIMATYRLSITIFFINFFLLKAINFYYNIQRVVVFFIINFAIYLSIINIFDHSNTSIALLGTIRNIGNSVLIFYADEIIPENLLQYRDYFYRIIANLLAMIVNLYYMIGSDLDGQLLFGIAFLYIGIQAFLMYYNVKHIQTYQPLKS